MKIIVTGATGFLGRRTAERLKEEGHQPIGLGRNTSIGKELMKSGIKFLQTDLSNQDQTRESFSKCCADCVIHCAALSSPWGLYSDFFNSNVKATENILNACTQYHILKIIHISTPSLYFNYKNRLAIKESDPLPSRMVNYYAETKKIAENLVLQSGMHSIILRPRGIFGPGDNAVFPRLLKSLDRLPLIDGGTALMDITYIDNVVDAILLSLNPEISSGQCFNITNDAPMTFIDIINLICKKLDLFYKAKKTSFIPAYYFAKCLELFYRMFSSKEPPVTCYALGLLATDMTLDISKAKSQLGYKPKISIEEGVENFAKWWRNRG